VSNVIFLQSQNSYGLDGLGSFSWKSKIFLFFIMLTPALGPTNSPIQIVPRAVFLGVKRQGPEADHSCPSNAEVKKGRAIPLLPHMS
jgi:hypothetical protein